MDLIQNPDFTRWQTIITFFYRAEVNKDVLKIEQKCAILVSKCLF